MPTCDNIQERKKKWLLNNGSRRCENLLRFPKQDQFQLETQKLCNKMKNFSRLARSFNNNMPVMSFVKQHEQSAC